MSRPRPSSRRPASALPGAALGALVVFVALGVWSCRPSVEDSIDRLTQEGADPDEMANEFLLARERAVGPLLEAFEDPQRARARRRLVDILFSLSMRVDDPRLLAALGQHLVADPDAEVRAAIAENAQLYNRAQLVPPLLQALGDAAPRVRQLALAALGALSARLDTTQRDTLRQATRRLLRDADPGVRLEARSRAAALVSTWMAEANQLQLQGRIAAAESVYVRALDYDPSSRQAHYFRGWHEVQNGDREGGLAYLRRHGMLLDVPRLATSPVVDGRLDDEVWGQAARADSLYRFFWRNAAWVPAEVASHFSVGVAGDRLYIGFRGHDDHPDSLVAKITNTDPHHDDDQTGARDNLWSDDCIEIMIDADLDRLSFVHLGINSLGVRADEFISRQPGSTEDRWGYAAEAEIAAHVGPDFWSLEIALTLDRPHLPRPAPGDLWGFNLVRNYRGEQYLQWVRTYGSGLQPDNFGFLLFR